MYECVNFRPSITCEIIKVTSRYHYFKKSLFLLIMDKETFQTKPNNHG